MNYADGRVAFAIGTGDASTAMGALLMISEGFDPNVRLRREDATVEIEVFGLECAKQLDELLAIRHCVFVMGPPGAGKWCYVGGLGGGLPRCGPELRRRQSAAGGVSNVGNSARDPGVCDDSLSYGVRARRNYQSLA